MNPKFTALLFVAMFLSCSTARAAEAPFKTVTAQGTGSISVPADLVEFDISVESIAEDAKKSSQDNAMRMKQVLDITKKSLINPEIRTINYQVIPEWSPRPQNPKTNWKPSVIGYKTVNTVRVSTKEIETASAVLARIVDAGADSVSNLRFKLSDRLKYRQDVIQLAVQQAHAEAVSACLAANTSCKDIVKIEIDPENEPDIPRPLRTMAFAEAAPPPIEAGDITISATVRVITEIRPGTP